VYVSINPPSSFYTHPTRLLQFKTIMLF